MKNSILLLVLLFLVAPVFAQPVINSFSPASGPVGTIVTITGAGFDTSPANNIVYFGGVKAPVTAATATTLQVTVPAGATYHPISVTAQKLTAYSANCFAVTFSPGQDSFTSTSFQPKKDFTSGIYPHSVSVADFNGDGKNDLLVSRGSSNSISVLPNTSTAGQLSFGAKLDFPATGNNHEGSATADLDGDGKLDVVLTNSTGLHSVSVYHNTSTVSTISFAPKLDLQADNAPYSVAVGDLNGDGKPDLAVANNGSNNVSLYLNNSTAPGLSFAAKTDIPVGTNPYGVAIRDLDGDGKADLAVTCQGSSSGLYLVRNTSDGPLSFAPPVNYAPAPGFFTVCIGDLDGDHKPDVSAVNAFSAAIFILKNNSTPGAFSFLSPQHIPAGPYPVGVCLADLNGDGQADLVAANRSANTVSVIQNTGTAGRMSFGAALPYAVGTDPLHVACGDLDGDSRPELISANSSDAFVSILKNQIGAQVAPEIHSFSPATGVEGTVVHIKGINFTGATAVRFGSVSAASFTVDSPTDITAYVGPGGSGEVSVTTGYGTATRPGFQFQGPVMHSVTPMVGYTGTVVNISGANFTGTREVKFGGMAATSFTVNSATSITAIVGTGSSGQVTVSGPNGTAVLPGFSFGPPTITSFSPAAGPAGTILTIKGTGFNADPSANVVFFGAVKALIRSASATQLEVIVPAGATYQPFTVTTNQLTAYAGGPFLVTFPTDQAALSASSFAMAGNFRVGTYPTGSVLADFNGDGKPDLVTANNVSNSLSILKNTSSPGKIEFTAGMDLLPGVDPKMLATGDLDRDGHLDLVAVNFNRGNASSIAVYRNTSAGGNISFAARQSYDTGNGTASVALTDMNGDGRPDIIVSSGNSGTFTIFTNTTLLPGTLSFEKQDFPVMNRPDRLALADLDQDGRPDLILSNFSQNSISVFRNTSTGGKLSLAPAVSYGSGTNPGFVTTGDFDGDGKADVVVSNYSAKTISFYKNRSSSGNILLDAQQVRSLSSTSLSAADLNGDGKLDLLSGIYLSGLVTVLENTYAGSGNFSFSDNLNFSTGTYDTYVSAGDLDGDGKPELALTNTMENTVSILRNISAEPVFTAFSTSTGSLGTVVTLTGRNLGGVTSIKFGGTPAESFKVFSSTRIDAVVGRGASGDITVTNAWGTGTLPGFNFIPGISAGGPTAFCQPGSVVLRSSANSNNQWYRDGLALPQASSDTILVSSTGSYSVKTSANGITTTSAPVEVKVTSITTPLIGVDADLNMVSSAPAGNQWYLNGEPIQDAHHPSYRPAQSGNYTVKSTVDGCSTDFSIAHQVTESDIVELKSPPYFRLSLDPAENKLNLAWKMKGISYLEVEIIDVTGRRVFLKKDLDSGQAVDLSLLAAGIYVLKAYHSTARMVYFGKFVKL